MQTMPQIRKNAPNKSIWSIFCLRVRLLCLRSGFLKKKKTVAIAMPPMGRLIQKHYQQVSWILTGRTETERKQRNGSKRTHLHEARSVRTPPRIGPITEEIPNMLDNMAIYIARFLNGTANPMIVIPPENKPEAPAPAMARPTISMTEL